MADNAANEPYVVSDERLAEIRATIDGWQPARDVSASDLAAAVYDLLAERDESAANPRDYDIGDPETAADFVANTWRYVEWGEREVEAGRMTVAEQSRRIRAALADACAWIERAES